MLRESGVTPDLDTEAVIRCARKLGPASNKELFASLNFVPAREEMVRILRDIGTYICSTSGQFLLLLINSPINILALRFDSFYLVI